MTETDCRAILGWKQGIPDWTGNYDYFHGKPPHDGVMTAIQRISPLELPPILTVEETCDVFGSPVLLSRLYEADWLPSLAEYQDELYFTSEVVYAALGRLIKGEKPPRSASEPPATAGVPEIGEFARWKHFKLAKAAELLGISRRTLSDAAEKGLVPFLTLGKHRLFNMDEVIDALKKNAPSIRITAAVRDSIIR